MGGLLQRRKQTLSGLIFLKAAMVEYLKEHLPPMFNPSSSRSWPLSQRAFFLGSDRMVKASPTSLNFFSSSFCTSALAPLCRSRDTKKSRKEAFWFQCKWKMLHVPSYCHRFRFVGSEALFVQKFPLSYLFLSLSDGCTGHMHGARDQSNNTCSNNCLWVPG